MRLYLAKQTNAKYAEYFASFPCSRGFTLPEQKARILNEFTDGLPEQFNLPYIIQKPPSADRSIQARLAFCGNISQHMTKHLS
jgi:hypothetical protein